MNSARGGSNGTLARQITGPRATKFYTYKELAHLWGYKEQTVRLWFMQLRRVGRGPAEGQVSIVQVNATTRFLKIRGDYAVFVQQVKIEHIK